MTNQLRSAAISRAEADPESYWLDAADAISWDHRPTRAYADGVWFPDGMLNTCFNAVDRHVLNGRGDDPALIFHSAMTDRVDRYSYGELRHEVALVAGMIASFGVTKGDRVVIYMPMVPEAVFAMLACARIGAVHSVVFGGFAAVELAKRLDDALPKLVITASCGIEPGRLVAYKPLVDAALELATVPKPKVVVLQRSQLTAELRPGLSIGVQTGPPIGAQKGPPFTMAQG